MNSPPPNTDPPVDQLSADDEEQVRRLLADARVEEPMPAEVADRMDATLADLAREQEELHLGVPPAERPAGPVVALSSRRRRVVGGLVAAAVIAVVGIGIGQVVTDTNQTPDAATTGGADRSVAGPEEGALSADDGAAADAESAPSRPVEPAPGSPPSVEIRKADAPVPVVRPERLRDDALRVRRTFVPADGRPARLYQRTVVISPVGFQCAGDRWGAGVFVGVEYDGRLALLAYHDPTGDQQITDVLQCGTGDLLRSTTIPAP